MPSFSLVLSLFFDSRDVHFVAPFPAVSSWMGTHTTYLDTTGRPILTFNYKDLVVKHAESIFVGFFSEFEFSPSKL